MAVQIPHPALALCKTGWHFDFPSSDQPGIPNGACQALSSSDDNWYVTAKDLAFFRYHGEGSGATQGASPWEVMMEKVVPDQMTYTAWRRVLPVSPCLLPKQTWGILN